MDVKFPKCLRAAKAMEGDAWELGDALLSETGESSKSLIAVQAELAANGFEHPYPTLAKWRQAAQAFPKSQRVPGVSITAHMEAGSADNLDLVIKVARKEGRKITAEYVRAATYAAAQAERNEVRRLKQQAEAEAAEAEAEEKRATERQRRAKDEEERARAARERVAAANKKRAAKERATTIKVAPKWERKPPAEEHVPDLVVVTSLIAKASEAKLLARSAKTQLGKGAIAQLPEKYVAGLIEDAMSAANAWSEVAVLLRKAAPKRGAHLSVVNE